MTNWHDLLTSFNASFDESGCAVFPKNSASDATTHPMTIHPLTTTGVLSVSGDDSKKFLQGQTTCNMDDISANQWMPGAICDPKGRMITSFNLYPAAENRLLLEMHQPLVAQTISAIEKYSAFFKAALLDDTEQYPVIGIQGENCAALIQQVTGASLNQQQTFMQQNDLYIIKVAADRYKIISPSEKTASLWEALSQQAAPANTTDWLLGNIQAGIGDITLKTGGLFVPQMINLQARGGISFKKGCYTGQEIVARMKYLGKLKRWMYRLNITSGTLPEPGTPCYLTGKNNAQGTVVNAAIAANRQVELLAVMTEELAQQQTITIGESPPQSFESMPLPYSLDQD